MQRVYSPEQTGFKIRFMLDPEEIEDDDVVRRPLKIRVRLLDPVLLHNATTKAASPPTLQIDGRISISELIPQLKGHIPDSVYSNLIAMASLENMPADAFKRHFFDILPPDFYGDVEKVANMLMARHVAVANPQGSPSPTMPPEVVQKLLQLNGKQHLSYLCMLLKIHRSGLVNRMVERVKDAWNISTKHRQIILCALDKDAEGFKEASRRWIQTRLNTGVSFFRRKDLSLITSDLLFNNVVNPKDGAEPSWPPTKTEMEEWIAAFRTKPVALPTGSSRREIISLRKEVVDGDNIKFVANVGVARALQTFTINFSGLNGRPYILASVNIPVADDFPTNEKIVITNLMHNGVAVDTTTRVDSKLVTAQFRFGVMQRPKLQRQSRPVDDKDADLVCGDQTISLLDPWSLKRIQTPCKGASCKHERVFDLDTYIEQCVEMSVDITHRDPGNWKCPICDQPCEIGNVSICGWFEEILRNVPADTEFISVSPDGSWKLRPPLSTHLFAHHSDEQNAPPDDPYELVDVEEFVKTLLEADDPTPPAGSSGATAVEAIDLGE